MTESLLSAEALAAACTVRGGLPRLAARAARAARGAALGARVIFCGGSVTAQRDGWRPAFQRWLDGHLPAPLGHDHVCAALGNCGSKVLAFMLNDWVVPPCERTPDLVVLEAAINDGDALLESGGDAHAIRRALEGCVRGIRAAAPHAEILLVIAHLRTELPAARRSGTLAWAHGDAPDAASVYADLVPRIHQQARRDASACAHSARALSAAVHSCRVLAPHACSAPALMRARCVRRWRSTMAFRWST
jgi:hypothetical protein